MTFEPPLYLQNDQLFEYSARQDRFLIDTIFAEGLLNAASTGAVTERLAAANLSVDVAPFDAIIDGDDIARQGAYLVRFVEGENKVTAGPPAAGTRRDLLVVEVIDGDAVALNGRPEGARLRILNGTPVTTGTPVEPTEPPTALRLASWAVTAGQTAIRTQDITRYRLQSAQVPAYNVDLQPVLESTYRAYAQQAIDALRPETLLGVEAVRAATNGVLDQLNAALAEARRAGSTPARTASFLTMGA